jgi:hypothetical protein
MGRVCSAVQFAALDLRTAAIVDNFLGEVLGGIFGRFWEVHRPWRWRPGGFFSQTPPNGKMGKRGFRAFFDFFRVFGSVFTGFWALFRTLSIHAMCIPLCA